MLLEDFDIVFKKTEDFSDISITIVEEIPPVKSF